MALLDFAPARNVTISSTLCAFQVKMDFSGKKVCTKEPEELGKPNLKYKLPFAIEYIFIGKNYSKNLAFDAVKSEIIFIPTYGNIVTKRDEF